MAQYYYLWNGQRQGPVDGETLKSYLQAGNLQWSDLVWTEGMADWAPASTRPDLGSPQQQQAPQPQQQYPQQPQQQYSQNQTLGGYSGGQPYGTQGGYGSGYGGGRGGYVKPHRSTTIVVLGAIGIFCCIFMTIAAWAMGSGDLKQMQMGQMDPSGEGATRTGMILGIIGTIIRGIGWIAFFAGMA